MAGSQTLQLPNEIDHGLTGRRAQIAEQRIRALRRRDNIMNRTNRPVQLQSLFAAEQRFLDRQREHPTMTFAELEQRHQRAHDDFAKQIPTAKDEAEQAAAELPAVDAEIARFDAELVGLDQEEYNAERVSLLRRLIPAYESFEAVQNELDANTRVGRERGWRVQDLGIWREPGPHSVVTYLRVLLAQLDPQYAATLDLDDPVRRKLVIVAKGGGIAAPGLRWG